MPRRNSDDLNVIAPRFEKPRLKPSDSMSEAQAAVWRATVNSLPGDWFSPAERPLIECFAQHVCRRADLEALLATIDARAHLDNFTKIARLIALETGVVASLARAMRLTPRSRLKAETAANRIGSDVAAGVETLLGGRKPWE
jgi:hypothetical protein